MKLIRFLIALLSLTLAFPLIAEQSETDTSQQRGTIVLKPKIKTNRPNAPSLFYVECIYGDSFLKFVLPEGVETLMYHLYNEDDEFLGVVSSDNPIAEIPSLHGEYNIECQDDGYRTYAGILFF